VQVARASPQVVDEATETITGAFRQDPVWGVALQAPDGRDEHLRPYWRIFVLGGMRYETVYVTPGAGTVSVWIPPGGTEVSTEQELSLRAMAQSALGAAAAAALFELWERFDDNHPKNEPHAYLSLLATRADLAGRGLGQAHLAADLARWDAAEVPTYLESSNPANDHRYQRQGYRAVAQFETVLDSAVVTTMWRQVGG
jgi:GNAT superfamily N-acetyltransferase